MFEELIQAANEMFPSKRLLTLEDVTQFLECEAEVIHNWIKRADPKKRPPRLRVGQESRFPKKQFIEWIVKEQATHGAE